MVSFACSTALMQTVPTMLRHGSGYASDRRISHAQMQLNQLTKKICRKRHLFLEYKLAACSGVQISTTRLLQDRLSDYSCDLQVHSASTVAGMAFANAFLGICHSIAHKVKSKRKHLKIPNDLGISCSNNTRVHNSLEQHSIFPTVLQTLLSSLM